MMSNEHKNFEDKLRDRLHSEEMEYEVGAWESFQELNGNIGNSVPGQKTNEENSRSGRGLWMSILLFICMSTVAVIAGKWGLDQLNENSLAYEVGKVEKKNLDNLSPNNSEKEEKEFDQLANQKDKSSAEEVDNLQNQNHDNPSFNINPAIDDESFQSIENSVNDSDSGKGVEERHPEQAIRSTNLNENSSASTSRNSEQNGSEVNIEIREDKVGNHKNSKIAPFINNGANLIESPEQSGGTLSDSISETKSEWIALDNNSIEDKTILVAAINTLDIQNLDSPVDLNFDKDIFIQPVEYKKNEFYIGTGFANNFSEFTTRTGTVRASREPTYYSLGYFRKLSPSWSLGLELNAVHLQNFSMSREIHDYHQTSTSFEFITGTLSHRYTSYIGLPVMLKFQPLGSRIGILGGVNVAYAASKSLSYDNEHEGINTVVKFLRAQLDASQYINNWDAGLIAGATFKIWKGFELEARAVYGLMDVSDDYFWGEGMTRSNNYRVGLKYRF